MLIIRTHYTEDIACIKGVLFIEMIYITNDIKTNFTIHAYEARQTGQIQDKEVMKHVLHSKHATNAN